MTAHGRMLYIVGTALLACAVAGCPFKDNPPDTPTRPTGADRVKRDSTYEYTTLTSDQDGDSVYFEFQLVAGSYRNSYWSQPVASGQSGSVRIHFYTFTSYDLHVRALDAHGLYSDWSPELTITVR